MSESVQKAAALSRAQRAKPGKAQRLHGAAASVSFKPMSHRGALFTRYGKFFSVRRTKTSAILQRRSSYHGTSPFIPTGAGSRCRTRSAKSNEKQQRANGKDRRDQDPQPQGQGAQPNKPEFMMIAHCNSLLHNCFLFHYIQRKRLWCIGYEAAEAGCSDKTRSPERP